MSISEYGSQPASVLEMSTTIAPTSPVSNQDTSPRMPSEAPSDCIGLSNPHLSISRRKMLDLVNKLHSTGVQVDIDLPQIAVIGSQSAGKSSLIESISGITLPRAAGTCTRCPTECRLSRTDSRWQCIVSLKFIEDINGQLYGQARNERFGEVIYEKSEVEERIRRAQLAILNPTKLPKLFLEGNDVDEHDEFQLSFSMNAVTLHISGPDVADLSFCDLPGLIASSISSGRVGGENDIALVESLVTTYIKKPSCIILLTVACETDFENQGAHRLAKQHDPNGTRTIGVLTKPDRIPLGEESNWLPFIRNEKETLENNWFCVKQPSSSELKGNITWSQARKMENNFFTSKAPWCELDGIYQKYLRTGNLVERLSIILSDLISKRLPQIQDELERSINDTRSLLQGLPPAAPEDPRSEISTLLHKLTSDLWRHTEGIPSDAHFSSGPTHIGLMQAIHPAQEQFRKAIRSTAPKFRPFKCQDSGKNRLSRPPFLLSEEGDDDNDDFDRDEDDDEDSSNSSRSENGPSNDTIYIDEVLERAEQARARELPGHYPFIVQRSLIAEFANKWLVPAQILCKAVHHTLVKHVDALVQKHFEHFGQRFLEQRVRIIMQQHMKKCLERTEEHIVWLIKLDDHPFSLNTHYLADYRSKFMTHYRIAREQYEGKTMVDAIKAYNEATTSVCDAGIRKILSGLAEIGMSHVSVEDLGKLLPPDPMEPALNIMADVRAYFQVAYKRFADIVPLVIDLDLVRGVEQGALETLYTSLGINGHDGQRICKELAQESPQTADRRLDLKTKLERLETASRELLSIGI